MLVSSERNSSVDSALFSFDWSRAQKREGNLVDVDRCPCPRTYSMALHFRPALARVSYGIGESDVYRDSRRNEVPSNAMRSWRASCWWLALVNATVLVIGSECD